MSELKKKCTESVEPASVAAVLVEAKNVSGTAVATVNNIDVAVCELTVPVEEVVHVGLEELIAEQEADKIIGPVLEYVVAGRKPNRDGWSKLSAESKVLMRSFNKLKMSDNGVLHRETVKYQQIVLPKKFHHTVYVELHEKMAHVGPEKVLDLAQQRFYWPKMSSDIEHYIRRKCRCIVTKKPNVGDKAHWYRSKLPTCSRWLLLISCIWTGVVVAGSMCCVLSIILLDSVKCMPHGQNLVKLLPRSCGMNSYRALDSQRRSITIRARNSIASCGKSSILTQV